MAFLGSLRNLVRSGFDFCMPEEVGELVGEFQTIFRVSLVAQMVKNPPALQGTWLWSLGWENPLKMGMAIYSSILPWKIPQTEEPGGLQSMRLQKVRHYRQSLKESSQTRLIFDYCPQFSVFSNISIIILSHFVRETSWEGWKISSCEYHLCASSEDVYPEVSYYLLSSCGLLTHSAWHLGFGTFYFLHW